MAFVLTLAATLLWASPAAANTYVVSNTSDLPDGTPGDDVCGVMSATGCSLRAAIEESNAHAGPDTVQIPTPRHLMLDPSGGTVR